MMITDAASQEGSSLLSKKNLACAFTVIYTFALAPFVVKDYKPTSSSVPASAAISRSTNNNLRSLLPRGQ